MIMAIETAVVEIRFRGMSFIGFMLVLTMPLKLAHAQIGLTTQSYHDPAASAERCS